MRVYYGCRLIEKELSCLLRGSGWDKRDFLKQEQTVLQRIVKACFVKMEKRNQHLNYSLVWSSGEKSFSLVWGGRMKRNDPASTGWYRKYFELPLFYYFGNYCYLTLYIIFTVNKYDAILWRVHRQRGKERASIVVGRWFRALHSYNQSR